MAIDRGSIPTPISATFLFLSFLTSKTETVLLSRFTAQTYRSSVVRAMGLELVGLAASTLRVAPAQEQTKRVDVTTNRRAQKQRYLVFISGSFTQESRLIQVILWSHDETDTLGLTNDSLFMRHSMNCR